MSREKLMYFVYILRSVPTGRYYVGSTGDIDARLVKHNKGYSKATKPYLPWELVYVEEYTLKSDAIKREYEIKRHHSRAFIEQLITRNV
jgi:putative endonuclease